MRYIESPEKFKRTSVYEMSIFLAGGITNCPDWQQEMRELLRPTELVLLNPRRADFPIGDPNAALAQITWEYEMLRAANSILFWFPCETICPIVLYELGAWTLAGASMYVGVHPDYQRRVDVEIQTGLARPDVEVVYSLEHLARQVIEDKASVWSISKEALYRKGE